MQARNGNTFIARRSETRRYVVEPGQKGGWLFQEAALEADVPGLGHIKWETSLHPWLLDRANDGRWYLIGMVGAYAADSEYGIFDGRGTGPRFVFYRAREGDWERILVNDLPTELATPNLLLYGEEIFDPDPRRRYWTPPSGPAPRRNFFNGERLELDLKSRLNVSDRADALSASRYDLAIVRAKFPWMLDHGTRNLPECVTGAPCNDACFKSGNVCRSVRRFEVGQMLGRPPSTVR